MKLAGVGVEGARRAGKRGVVGGQVDANRSWGMGPTPHAMSETGWILVARGDCAGLECGNVGAMEIETPMSGGLQVVRVRSTGISAERSANERRGSPIRSPRGSLRRDSFALALRADRSAEILLRSSSPRGSLRRDSFALQRASGCGSTRRGRAFDFANFQRDNEGEASLCPLGSRHLSTS
jgi:hypothetical protein